MRESNFFFFFSSALFLRISLFVADARRLRTGSFLGERPRASVLFLVTDAFPLPFSNTPADRSRSFPLPTSFLLLLWILDFVLFPICLIARAGTLRHFPRNRRITTFFPDLAYMPLLFLYSLGELVYVKIFCLGRGYRSGSCSDSQCQCLSAQPLAEVQVASFPLKRTFRH